MKFTGGEEEVRYARPVCRRAKAWVMPRPDEPELHHATVSALDDASEMKRLDYFSLA
jgi:hypothetical protein